MNSTYMIRLRNRRLNNKVFAEYLAEGYRFPNLAHARRIAGIKQRIKNGNLTKDLKQRRCTQCEKWYGIFDNRLPWTHSWCRYCQLGELRERRARGEEPYYVMECLTCSKDVTKGPFCSEKCRKRMELIIIEGIV